MSLSQIEHLNAPEGDCTDAVPALALPSRRINTLRSDALCWMVTTHPLTDTVPVPLYTVPPQQNLYCPVWTLNSTAMLGSVSSCRQALKAVTVKLQVAVLPDGSVAVQVTVFVPIGKVEPEVTTALL